MAADTILTASTIITMDDARPRARALAFDSATGRITAIGSVAEVQAAAPGVAVTDLGSTVLMPGFVEPHSHPLLSGMATQEPAYWVSPNVGVKTWDDVTAIFARADKDHPADQALVFNGVDRLLQQAPLPTRDVLDTIFPSRPVVVIDNSGHGIYFNSATIALMGWADGKAPADPVGGSFGREADGVTSNGTAFESGALMIVAGAVLPKAIPHPLHSGALFYKLMAQNGVTATSEHTYNSGQFQGYTALASVPGCPLRLHVYHMSIESDAADDVVFPNPDLVRKVGIKLWADGSPWLGNVAISFEYLDNPTTRTAEIETGPRGEPQMNYTRAQLDAVLDQLVPAGYQMAFHCNGDVGFDVVLDAYARALAKHNLLGSDHRWRVEHLGAARRDQFERAAALGVTCSMSPFQYIYWGDLLDGVMFESEYGAQWQRVRDAFEAGVTPSYHNDGSVTPPNQLLNVQQTVTRRTINGNVHGANQAVTLDDALKAITINGAYQLKRDHEIGSLAVGKYADLVELSADIYTVAPDQIVEKVKVLGTWLGGKKIDIDAYVDAVKAVDPTEHQVLTGQVATKKCC
ncbi:amidohydrolase [Mycolicibacterium sp.]|uniref:amidohydrolase n=1 Tax=Mycolicibacterium sp. TaxID=2320850 RepID=UPI0028AAAA88|nr:amidohydrolase [Mycolicibacterium sp.]